MALSCLAIGQAVVQQLGLPNLPTIVGNPNATAVQVLALMNMSGDEIYQSHPWTVSQAEHIVQIGTPVTTIGDVAAGSDIITNIPSTAGIQANYYSVIGQGLLQSTRVVEIIDGTTVRVDMQATVSTLATELVFAKDTYDVPEEFKWFANDTMWDRTNQWQLVGPMSPQLDQWERSGIVPSTPVRRWRQIGVEPTVWRLWPAPTASGTYPATLVFEYNSKFWAATAAGVRREGFVADDDIALIDGQAIIRDVKWRMWQSSGFSFGAMQMEALDYISRLKARDGGATVMSLARPRRSNWLIGPWNTQDGNFPGEGNP